MQINPFGFPLGAGTQSASAFAGTGLGFIDALGVVAEGGAPQQFISLTASPTPPAHFDAKLSQTLLAQAQLDTQAIPATVTLPGLQQPTSLSQLMTTAAKLPVAEPAPLAPAAATATDAPVADPATVAEAPEVPVQPEAPIAPQAQVQAQPGPAKPRTQPQMQTQTSALPADGQPQLGETFAAETPAVAAPTETPPTSRKAPRTAAADADPAQPADAKATVPAELLAAGVPPQPIAQSQPQQPAPREAMQAANGATAPVTRKSAAAHAPAGEAGQPGATAGTPSTADFANAVAARGDSTGGETNADAQGQPDARPAGVARTDIPAPAFQPTQTAAGPGAPTSAPAPTEPVIEARSGHLGQSLGVEIARKVELGEETLRIRLNPIELGRIEVTLAFDDKGSLQATVRTESAQAMDLLRQDAPDLARTLDQAGVRTDAQSFRFESRAGDGGGQQAQQQHQQSNRGQFASSDDDAGAAEPIYRPVRSDGQVDLIA
ncbi:MAG: flagellar hook-length control protein FliK [Sphingomonas sp.]|uniref:flagellar hook-length control protein FliK n=1 Tax=Sphingomonas sp. TaxID=28214 RepID=UPI002273D922|nr:flagellar hook-length control protein FliK [Sphingomonas sp.]MCX8476651.1 flagellar hook-length control protein FliK [Sphingomonas sp.]